MRTLKEKVRDEVYSNSGKIAKSVFKGAAVAAPVVVAATLIPGVAGVIIALFAGATLIQCLRGEKGGGS